MVRRLANALQASQVMGIHSVLVPRDVVFHQEVFAKSLYEVGPSRWIWFGAEPVARHNQFNAIVVNDFFDSAMEKTP